MGVKNADPIPRSQNHYIAMPLLAMQWHRECDQAQLQGSVDEQLSSYNIYFFSKL